MLNSLRKHASGWVAQLLMGILVLSFAVWGVADIFTGFRSNDVAMVGSATVTVTEFQRSYDSAIRNLQQQFGTGITQEQALAAGVPQQVLGQLVATATLDDTANRMGLGISDKLLGERITSDPQYRGSTGVFDRDILSAVLQSQGYTEDDFILKRREDFVRSQIVEAFATGTTAPDAYMRALHEYRGEERTASYVVLTAPAVTAIPEPTETELAAYYEANKRNWMAPELRTVSYFRLSPAEVADTAEVTDEDAKKRYDMQPDRWATKELRNVEQIVFATRAEAEAAAAAITSGKTFDALVIERNLKPADTDLGVVTRERIADTEVADAAFALAPGGVSGVVDGRFGPVIVRVSSIMPPVVTTFDMAKADLKKEIASERAVAEISGMYEAIEDARAGGDTLADAAAKFQLKHVTLPPIDSSGNDANGTAVADLPNGLASAAFDATVGLANDPIQPDETSYIWFDVTSASEARDRTLSEVRDRVVAAWKDAERVKKLDEQAAAVKKRLTDKEAIATMATSLGLTVVKAEKLTRGSPPNGSLTPTTIPDLFNGPKGTVGEVDGVDPFTKVVFVIDDVIVPPYVAMAPELTQGRETLDTQFVNDLLGLYVAEISGKTQVTYNETTIQQLFNTTGTQ